MQKRQRPFFEVPTCCTIGGHGTTLRQFFGDAERIQPQYITQIGEWQRELAHVDAIVLSLGGNDLVDALPCFLEPSWCVSALDEAKVNDTITYIVDGLELVSCHT